MADNINIARTGINLDSDITQISPGELTYAKNAMVEGFSGEAITYQNEPGNTLCVTFPDGYKDIGNVNITQLKRVIYMLTNPITGNSQIGYSDNNSCTYNILIDDSIEDSDLLGFNTNYPIRKIIPKTTNCSTQIYWTDGNNPRRYLDFSDLPWKEEINPDNIFKPIKLVGKLDNNKLLVQANFSIPKVGVQDVVTGGILKMGTYQFTIQYSNSTGEGYTSYYNVTNPVGIYQNIESTDFNLPTTRAIKIGIENLDTSGLYSYFNIAVIKTINNISTVERVGTFNILSNTYEYTYTGAEASPEPLTIEDIFEKVPYYDTAQDIFEVDNVLGWSNLTSNEDTNYQTIWNRVQLKWETWKLPYSKFQAYNNGANTSNLKGYMRDEVYAFEGCFILQNGQQTKSFHIPGRMSIPGDWESITNKDALQTLDSTCSTPTPLPKWKVYNTGSLIDYTEEYKNRDVDDNCYIGSYQYGEMAFWQSSDSYPNNPTIWGELANQSIRHHCFPDSTITHIHDNNDNGDQNFEHSVYPIGIRVDTLSLYDAIKTAVQNNEIEQSEADKIAGFKITRGNRVANKRVIAKGLFNNVGKYTSFYNEDGTNGQSYYYPNYPYNDVRPDPYFSSEKLSNHQGLSIDTQLQGFSTEESKSRYVFHSPDTHFYQPSLGPGQQIKIETIEYGESYGHFLPVKDNAEYKFLLRSTIASAAGLALASVVGASGNSAGIFGYLANVVTSIFSGGGGAVATKLEAAIPVFNQTLELFQKLTPYTNLGYTFNSIGLYNKYFPVPNSGDKIRLIEFDKYLVNGIEGVEESNRLNNFNRESSVYINTADTLPFADTYDSSIPEDNSRYTLSTYNGLAQDNLTEFIQLIQTTPTNTYTNDRVISNFLNNGTLGGELVYIFTQERLIITYSIGDIINWTDNTGTIVYGQFLVIGSTRVASTFSSTTYDWTLYTTLISGNPSTIGTNLNAERLIKVSGPSTFPVSANIPFNKTSLINMNQWFLLDTANKIDYINRTEIAISSVNSVSLWKNLLISTGDPRSDYVNQSAFEIIQQGLIQYTIDKGNYLTPEQIRQSNICSYYGAIKQVIDNQWGQIYSYETIDTGFYSQLYKQDGSTFSEFPTVFGGDIFINRFALKTKTPIFTDNTVKQADGLDIAYDELGNYGYPMFWYSTKDIESLDSSNITNAINNFANSSTSFGNVLAMGIPGAIAGFQLAQTIMQQIVSVLGVKNTNMDNYIKHQNYETGVAYLFVYGIPYFFVESEVNTDFRQATNQLVGNFYPNTGTGIPDDWLQEASVSIVNDNTYNYNQTYSKQNKEDFFVHLSEDYDPDNLCTTNFPNRAIWSDKSSLEERKNNWLVYKPSAYFDFPKAFGKLISLDSLSNREVLARFENKSQIYNAMTSVQVTGAPNAYLANPQLFSGTPPIDLSQTDIGYGGSQHVFLLRTEYGNIYIDAERGQVILLQGQQVTDLANKNWSKWFQQYLPFKISGIEGVNTDNNFNGIGLHGVYDAFYDRMIITKLDYIPLKEGIIYENGKFYFDSCKKLLDDLIKSGKGNIANVICNDIPIEISLSDDNYFCNNSWTISYNFKTQSWISFHSYAPEYYIGFNEHFQSGKNENGTLWNHNLDFTIFNKYFGEQAEYVLEYPIVYKQQDEILQSVKDYCIARKYSSYGIYKSTSDYFTSCIINNDQQCTGILNLVPRRQNDLSQYTQYPKYNSDSKDIIVTKSDNFYQFNGIFDIVKNIEEPIYVKSCDLLNSDKDLNVTNLDYTLRNHKNYNIRGKDCRIRLSLTDKSDINLITKFTLTQSATSYK